MMGDGKIFCPSKTITIEEFESHSFIAANKIELIKEINSILTSKALLGYKIGMIQLVVNPTKDIFNFTFDKGSEDYSCVKMIVENNQLVELTSYLTRDGSKNLIHQFLDMMIIPHAETFIVSTRDPSKINKLLQLTAQYF